MVDDAAIGAPRRPALDPLGGVAGRLLAGEFAQAHCFEAHVEPGAVHHREHVGKPLVLRSHEIADGAPPLLAVGHGAGGAAVDAELVFEGDGAHIVALPGRAVRRGQEFGNEEKRDAVDARRSAFDPRENEVDDVLGHGVIAPGDEDLLAEDAVMAGFGNRPGADRAEVRTRLGFGEIHRASPSAADHGFEIARLQSAVAVQLERLDGALAEHGANRKTQIGASPHFRQREIDRGRQAHAAEAGVRRAGIPAALGELAVGLRETRRLAHLAIDEFRRLGLPRGIQRREHVFGELGGFFENRGHEFRARLLERRIAANRADPRELAQHEAHFPQRRPIAHALSPLTRLVEAHSRLPQALPRIKPGSAARRGIVCG